jgi:putative ABC transport system permease protein
MGTGTVVIGLASVIIGRAIFAKATIIQGSTSVIIGSIIYRIAIGVALKLGFPATDMKLLIAVFFVVVIVLQNESWRKRFFGLFKRSEGGKDA